MAAPTQLRIGGGAADNVYFTGDGGARGNCSLPGVLNCNICMDTTYWSELVAFAAAAKVDLVYDLNVALRTDTGVWDVANTAALFRHASSLVSRPVVWQLGNEVEDFYKGSPTHSSSHDFSMKSLIPPS